jgi:hypothetical protein
VVGLTDNPSGTGVEGNANATTGFNFGIKGRSNSTSGVGVHGRTEAETGNTVGVAGEVNSSTGTAGLFLAPQGTTSFLLRGNNNGSDVFKVDGDGNVFAAAYKNLAGNPIGGGTITAVNTSGTSGLSGGGSSGVLNIGLIGTCSNEQILKWNGSGWACALDATGGNSGTAVYDSTGNVQSAHIVRGSVVLSAGTATINLTGAAAFSSTSSYNCTATYAVIGSNPAPNTPLEMGVYQLAGNQFVIRGPADSQSPGVNYICVGT